jgi:hypothetical protein
MHRGAPTHWRHLGQLKLVNITLSLFGQQRFNALTEGLEAFRRDAGTHRGDE